MSSPIILSRYNKIAFSQSNAVKPIRQFGGGGLTTSSSVKLALVKVSKHRARQKVVPKEFLSRTCY